MRSTTFFIAALAIAAGRVMAQDPTTTDSAQGPDTTGIPACVMTCTMQEAPGAGCDVTNATCLCASEAFQTAAAQCIAATCSADEQAAALEYQTQLCGSAEQPAESISASAAITSSADASSSSVPSASVISSASEATGSASNTGNAATALKMPSTSFLALGATALGFVVGPLLMFA